MDRATIARFASLGGLELDARSDVTIEGGDPIFETPFHLGEGAATALALVGQEASRLWCERGGRPQAISVDARHAAASLVSYAHLQVPEREIGRRGAPILTNLHPCKDGRWIHLHQSFVDEPKVRSLLGLPADAGVEAIAAETAKRDAWTLEDELAAARLCGAVARSAEEWATHPQAQWLAARPVVELLKIGDAPPEPLPEGARPLTGVRALDLTRVLAGPTIARTLAEHGAEVMHIASPSLPTFELFEMDTGHGKRQAFIDLQDAEQTARLRELVPRADVFSQGFRYGTLAKRGFSPEALAELRPGIIYASENCYGAGGPWAGRPGWEQLAQTTTGVVNVQGGSDHPRLTPAAQNDYTTGYFGALGVMMALRRRALEGGSWHVRVSLSRTSMWYYALGRDCDRAAARGLGEVSAFTQERDTPYGRMIHLRPALQMSETPPHWDQPTTPIGTGDAAW